MKENLEKVTGIAQYVVDLAVPGMAYAKVLRSPLPHAKIIGIDCKGAREVPGVYAVLTREDLIGVGFDPYYGEPIRDQSVLAIDRVRYDGDPIAAVAAVDEQIAQEALNLIDVEYEELPVVMDPVEAMRPGSALLYDFIELAEGPQAGIHPLSRTNICHRYIWECGDVENSLKQADYVFEDVFINPSVYHHPLEPHACLADVQDAAIRLWTNSQNPFKIRSLVARMFRLSPEKVHVTVPYVGGSFGAKSGEFKLEPLALALSWKAKRPVKIVASSGEGSKIVTRHATRVTIKSGVKKSGELLAREAEIILDTGAYATGGPRLTNYASEASIGPYKCRNIRVISYCVYTNKTPAGAYRGFGKTQVAHACEVHTDRIARELRMDPLELRRKNMLRDGDIHPRGDRLNAVGLGECLEQAAKSIEWENPAGKAEKLVSPNPIFRGKGLAIAVKSPPPLPSRATVVTEVKLNLGMDGRLTVFSGTVNMGQGSDTVLAQMAAKATKIPISQIQVVHSDTDLVPYDLSTYGSRSTFHMGAAIEDAAAKLVAELKNLAAGILGVKPDEIEMVEGECSHRGTAGRMLKVAEIIERHGAPVQVLGKCIVGGPRRTPEGEFPDHATYRTWCAAAAEVEVDRETGLVHVVSYAHACDVGNAINRMACEGQMEGSAIMSLGPVLFEELVYEDGRLLNPSLIDYPLPTMGMIPRLISRLVERPHDRGGFGAKGLGDVMTVVTPAAIVNAIYDATGVLIRELPLSPHRVLEAIRRAKAGER